MSWIQGGYGQLTQTLGNTWGIGSSGFIRFVAKAIGTSIAFASPDPFTYFNIKAISESIVFVAPNAIFRPSLDVIGESISTGRIAPLIVKLSSSTMGVSIVEVHPIEIQFISTPFSERLLNRATVVTKVKSAAGTIDQLQQVASADRIPVISPINELRPAVIPNRISVRIPQVRVGPKVKPSDRAQFPTDS